ncbi:MAG: carbohydrate ABC transporter permease [Anaerolineae bacterium]|nr:carbohydrate ABC transporter permease [Anaerolineae bacterium]
MSLQPLPSSHPQRWRTLLIWLALIPLALIILAPMWHMAVYAFVPERAQFAWPFQWVPGFPSPVTLQHFITFFQDPEMPAARWFLNTLIVTLVGTALVVSISALSGYAFARLRFPGRDTIFFIMLIGLMVPTAVTLIPSFLLLRDIKVLDSHLALWIPALANVGGMFLLRQGFFGIPRELEDAARVDGAGRFRIFWQVCLPLVQSSLVAQSILSFLFFWNDLTWPLIVLSDRAKLTLPVGILFMGFNSGVGLYFAAGSLSALPVLLFYALFHRQIIEGVTTAGLAGR